ncbi:MAG TPA: EamA family transporter [Archangium sp.]|uniref:EamA family transporter n=1 Tax=Archangium sp. TaxID=1872627 RepID=UPI002ED9AEC7
MLSSAALVLVLSSAFFHALWNALLKRHEDPENAVVGVIAVTVVSGGLWALGLEGDAFPSSQALLWTLVAGVLESGYLATLARALHHAPLGLAYTVSRGGALLLVWPVSVLWLGERLTPWAVVGAALVALGMAVMNLVRPQEGRVGEGVLWALACAACIAGFNVSYKRALGAGAQPPALFTLSLGVALPLLVLPRLRGQSWPGLLRKVIARPLLLVAAGLLCTLSFSLLLLALAHSGAGAVLTLRNTSIAFALGLGALQGERLGRRQLAGAGLVLLGAVVLGWPRA